MDSDYVTLLQQNHPIPHSLPDQLHVGATVNVHSTPIRSTEHLPSSSSLPLTPIVINSSDPLEGPSCNHSDSFTSPASCDSFTTSFRRTREVFSPVSQFLSLPISIFKHPNNKRKRKEKAGSGERVLTSEESLALMEEKEWQKKKEEKTKQRRKLERKEKGQAKEKEERAKGCGKAKKS